MRPITLMWPGGEHEFALPLGQLRALQGATDKGPEELLNALRLGTWRVDDAIQTIRWGLAGGGSMSSAVAAQKVTALFDLHPKSDFKLCAMAVLMHSLVGQEDDPLGEPEGVTPAPESGGSQGSTETGP